MGGIILYLLTLALETISVVVRFAIVAGICSVFFGQQVGIAIGAVAGLYPPLYSLAVMAGLPCGHLLTRLEVGGRRLSPEEQQRLDAALDRPRSLGIPIPRHIFAVDRDGYNAFIAGRSMYIYRDLFYHECLAGVIAHELGHHNSLDGRLSGAIFGLTLPGGFLITYMLLSVLQWVAYGIVLLLVGLVVIVILVMGVNIAGLLGGLFGITVTVTRFLIIFAVGGVGTALLGSLWRAYYVEREYKADAYAGRLGYGRQLISFFETEVLSDVAVPWYSQPTHPPATRRIEALRRVSVSYPQANVGPRVRQTPARGAPRPSHQPMQTLWRSGKVLIAPPSPRWLLIATASAGLVGILLLAAALFVGSGASPASLSVPAAVPTPTLGIKP